jgi:hypothetical protein
LPALFREAIMLDQSLDAHEPIARIGVINWHHAASLLQTAYTQGPGPAACNGRLWRVCVWRSRAAFLHGSLTYFRSRVARS